MKNSRKSTLYGLDGALAFNILSLQTKCLFSPHILSNFFLLIFHYSIFLFQYLLVCLHMSGCLFGSNIPGKVFLPFLDAISSCMSADVWWLASVRPAVRSSHRLEPASVHCSLYPVYCTVYSVVYSVHCTVHCTQNVFPVQSGSHSAPLEVLKGWAGPGDTVSPGWQGLHNWLQPGGWKGTHKVSQGIRLIERTQLALYWSWQWGRDNAQTCPDMPTAQTCHCFSQGDFSVAELEMW